MTASYPTSALDLQHLLRLSGLIIKAHTEKMKKPYDPQFPKGSSVKIASRTLLEQFQRDWSFHNKLESVQLEFAGHVARVEAVGYYHGGDELYKLDRVPGIWRAACLTATK